MKLSNWQNGLKWLALGLLTLGLVGCDEGDDLTHAEKQNRQVKALDLAGTYSYKASDGVENLLVIKNEHYTHDIRMILKLESGLDQTSKNKIKADVTSQVVRISDEELDTINSELERLLKDFEFGYGHHFDYRGGENVALDADGNTSELVVASEWYTFHVNSEFGEKYSMRVTSYMTGYKEQNILDYRVTGNTDITGKFFDRKGIRLEIIMETNSGDHRCELVSDLFLALGTFHKISDRQ